MKGLVPFGLKTNVPATKLQYVFCSTTLSGKYPDIGPCLVS